MQLRRPIRWVEERRENFLSHVHGRGQIDYVEAAVTQDGEIVGLRVTGNRDIGGYYQFVTPVIATLTAGRAARAIRRSQNISFTLDGVFTNKTPVGAYRGAGRPEATYLLERIIDASPRGSNSTSAEVRRKNFIQPGEFPYQTPYRHLLRLRRIRQGARPAAVDGGLRRPAPRTGRRPPGSVEAADRHRAVAAYLEICAFGPWESATVRVEPSGKVSVLAGTSPHGQGHVTTLQTDRGRSARRRSGRHHRPIQRHGGRADRRRHVRQPLGGDRRQRRPAARRSGCATRSIRIAAEALEASTDDIELEPGRISVRGVPGSHRRPSAEWPARRTRAKSPTATSPGSKPTASSSPTARRSRSASHLAVVEIDRDTGQGAAAPLSRRRRLRHGC